MHTLVLTVQSYDIEAFLHGCFIASVKPVLNNTSTYFSTYTVTCSLHQIFTIGRYFGFMSATYS